MDEGHGPPDPQTSIQRKASIQRARHASIPSAARARATDAMDGSSMARIARGSTPALSLLPCPRLVTAWHSVTDILSLARPHYRSPSTTLPRALSLSHIQAQALPQESNTSA